MRLVQPLVFIALRDVRMRLEGFAFDLDADVRVGTRLWYQAGWVGAPPLEATMT